MFNLYFFFQGVGRKGLLPSDISDDEFYDDEYYGEYYDDQYYYYDDYWENEDDQEEEEKVEGSKFNEATVLENILDILKQGMGAGGEEKKDKRKGGDFQNFKSFHKEKGDVPGVIGGYRTGYRSVLLLSIYLDEMLALVLI